MNIHITEVPNPNIRYIKFAGTLHESFKSIKGVICVEKTQNSSWDHIEKEIFRTINTLPGFENTPFVKTRKVVSEKEFQNKFEEDCVQLNREIDELLDFVNKIEEDRYN